MSSLANKVALVTGGTSGIGRATAIAFAAAGAQVVVSGRRKSEGDETVKLIQQAGGEGKFVQGDVLQEEQIANIVAETVVAYGKLDIAFNNAGVEGTLAPITEQTAESIDQVLGINVRGVILSMKHEFKQLIAQGHGGSIINTASIAGHGGIIPGLSVYVASKHAIVGATKTAALEGAEHNIRVNAVSPGGVQTDMLDRFSGGDASEFAAMHPLGRVGTPDEIAALTVFLASDETSFVTGQSYVADGGWLAR
jgi:NAD(P)-dependent dehydrogenase (short-subunit alcohol dehydrogenase family)